MSVEYPLDEQEGRHARDIRRRDHGERHIGADRAPVDPLVPDKGDAPEEVFHEIGRAQAYHFRILERVKPGFEVVQAEDRPRAFGEVRSDAAQGDDARDTGLRQGRHEGRTEPILVVTEIGGVVSRRNEDEGPTGSRERLLQKRGVADIARPRLRPLRGQRSETDTLPPDDADRLPGGKKYLGDPGSDIAGRSTDHKWRSHRNPPFFFIQPVFYRLDSAPGGEIHDGRGKNPAALIPANLPIRFIEGDLACVEPSRP